MFYEKYKKVNSGNIGILFIIDINNRFVYGYTIKNKSAQEISDKLK